jgi:hypothetical protein
VPQGYQSPIEASKNEDNASAASKDFAANPPAVQRNTTSNVTPVGMPLGRLVEGSRAGSPPASPPAAPPASTAWIPANRTGTVGQVGAGSAENQGIQTGRTAKARKLRRRWRERQSYAMATLLVGGICLALLLIVLAVVAMNR